MKALHIWLFPIHSSGNVGHYSPLPLGPNVLASTLPVGDQALIPFYHDPTFHPILSGLRLQWCTHSPPTGLNFASLLGLCPQEKDLNSVVVQALHKWLFTTHSPGDVEHYGPSLWGLTSSLAHFRPEIRLWYHSIMTPPFTQYCPIQGYCGAHMAHQSTLVLLLY